MDLQSANCYGAGVTGPLDGLGAALAALRKRAGLTQAQLSERTGISVQLLSRYEGGQHMRMETLEKILGKLDADLADLGRATEPENDESSPRRSRYHYIAEETGRVAQLRLDELEAKVRRLQLDVDDLKDSRV